MDNGINKFPKRYIIAFIADIVVAFISAFLVALNNKIAKIIGIVFICISMLVMIITLVLFIKFAFSHSDADKNVDIAKKEEKKILKRKILKLVFVLIFCGLIVIGGELIRELTEYNILGVVLIVLGSIAAAVAVFIIYVFSDILC